jgi:hypothetical protein
MTVDPISIFNPSLDYFYSRRPWMARDRGQPRIIMGYSAAMHPAAMPIEPRQLSNWYQDRNPAQNHGFRLSLALPCTSGRGMVE